MDVGGPEAEPDAGVTPEACRSESIAICASCSGLAGTGEHSAAKRRATMSATRLLPIRSICIAS